MMNKPETIKTDKNISTAEPDATRDAIRNALLPPLKKPPAAPRGWEALDRDVHAAIAKATSGVAPTVLGEAWMDWAVHFAVSPGKQLELATSAMLNARTLWARSLGLAPSDGDDDGGGDAESRPDRRFADDAWRTAPFHLWAQAHIMTSKWWRDAMTDVHGVAKPHEDLMAFTTGHLVDKMAPSNFLLTNPEVIAATVAEQGQNLVRGARYLAEDMSAALGAPQKDGAKAFEVGRNLAVSPGKVVFRNDLIELIQYAPTTETVHPEPILIVPAWIMKFYILDLSPANSLVRFLTGQGFTVFMVSWKNPDANDRDLGMGDYRQLGIMDAIDAATAISGSPRLHGLGYCLGGTLLSIAAAAMARDGDERLASLTLLAAQIDFTEAGPLRLFINESQVTLIEDMMSEQGFLSSDQMAGAFALLRARDLIWGPAISSYMLGKRAQPFDLMAWNADATRMPARMHSEYLRWLFLNNDLTGGRYRVGDRSIAVTDIRTPIFAVGTEDDHVAPWRSVYKLHLFTDADMTFVLTSGGHNAGIVSEPGHANRHFRIADTAAHAPYNDPTEWLEATAPQDGSWWIALAEWLVARSGEPGPLPPMGARSGRYAALCDAPGEYVMQS